MLGNSLDMNLGIYKVLHSFLFEGDFIGTLLTAFSIKVLMDAGLQ